MCVGSVALKGGCRAVCQHQGYVVASCADRLCIFDLVRLEEGAAEGSGGGSAAGSGVRFQKVADKLIRYLMTSYPMTCLSADLWSLAVGDTGNSVR